MSFNAAILCVAAMLATGASARVAIAQGLRGLVGDLTRESARLADDIPVRSIDDFVEEASRSRALRDAIEKESAKASRKLTDAARQSEAVLALLREARSIDPATLKRVGELEGPAQATALAVVRGGKEVVGVVPDLAARSKLVTAGGPELLIAVGTQSGKAAKDVILGARRLQEAIDAGKLITTTGRTATLADYARAVVRYGDATIKFWDRYVVPHWGKWLTGGALAAYLLDPEGFQDKAGDLTEAGFRQLTVLTGEVTAAMIRGAGSGSGEATKTILAAIYDTFLTGPNRVYSVVGMLLVGAAMLLRFRRVRHWAGRPFRWLDETPNDRRPRS